MMCMHKIIVELLGVLAHHQILERRRFWRKHHFHRYWKWSPDGSTKSSLASTCSQQDFTPMASNKLFSRWTL